MLLGLSIQNFILIENLFINFKPGLNVITGETGAGKSLVLEALCMVLGKRANVALIKNKNIPAIISAEFDISSDVKLQRFCGNLGIVDTTVILKRVIENNGKSRVFINDAVSTIKQLHAVSCMLLEICGQHYQYGLFDHSTHIRILDEYAQIHSVKMHLNSLFAQLKAQEQSLAGLLALKEKSLKEKLYLEHVLNDIHVLSFRAGEEIELERRRKKLLVSNRLRESNAIIAEKLSSDDIGVLKELYSLQRICSKLPEYLGALYEQFNEAILILEEIAKQSSADIEIEESENIVFIEDRIFQIRNFARKYSIEISAINEFIDSIIHKMESLTNIDDIVSDAQEKLMIAKAEYIKCAREVSDLRKSAAVKLRSHLVAELSEIKMERADFIIRQQEKKEEHWASDGVDDIAFLIQTNPGMEFGVMSDIASGGELSRIMLACKIAMCKVHECATIIFDEIDAGISGAVASSVGRKLSKLSKNRQVILVTHQPQVAVFADHHYLLTKHQSDTEVQVSIVELNYAKRLQEVARMFSGDQITAEAIKASETLYKEARN